MQLATKENKAVALVTVLIFVLISAIIAGALVALVSSEARLIESQIRRIKAIYAAEAGIQQAIQGIRSNPSHNPDGDSYSIGGMNVSIGYDSSGAGPLGTNTLDAQVNYNIAW
jgi:type II secretory pathway component PulK